MSLEQHFDGLELEQHADVFDGVPSHGLGREEDAAEEAANESDDTSPDDMTCAICLERTALTDMALVKGCEHQYCVHCILQWAMCKEWCPQCKKPFDYLLCHRQLDGTLTDFLVEESVVLLKRARWFEDHMREQIAKGKAVMPTTFSSGNSSGYAAAAQDTDNDEHRDWADFYEDYVDAELEEDEEIEQYYFSSAAGRARVVLGNRRWGEGGYMRAGRMYARPVPPSARTPNAAGGKTAKAGKAASKGVTGTSPGASSSRAGGAGSSSAAAAATGASSTAGGAGGSSSASRAGGAGSNSSNSNAAAGASNSTGGRGRTAAAWLDDDDDDFDYDDDFPYAMGGSGGASGSSRRNGSCSGSRSRSRPDRPAGMVKPIRQVPKNSPVCSMAAVPVVSPLGRSPGSGNGFQVGSWGASGSGGTPSAGSTPGSGRRAKRNARRAAVDAGGGGDEWD